MQISQKKTKQSKSKDKRGQGIGQRTAKQSLYAVRSSGHLELNRPRKLFSGPIMDRLAPANLCEGA